MKVSLINVNLVAEDAIGACLINQVRFFRRRGDEARVYVLHPPQNAPADVADATRVVSLADLIGGRDEHFGLSDLYIYHYPGRHALMESIRGIDRGTVIFYYHNVTPPALWGSQQDLDLLIQGVEGVALAHYADFCITDSPFNKRDLVERVGIDADRVFVLPLAVPLEQFKPGDRDPALVRRYGLEGGRVLLYVGRMAGNKRIDLLVEALARVKGEFPQTRLLLVGDDRSAPAFREIVAAARVRAQALGIADDVIWTGRVDDLPAHYRLADVYVTASLHEGFGVPLIEAMASGVPVVASRAGAMPWVIQDAGRLCEPGDAGDLADKVLTLLQDAALYHSLVERGLERVQAFSLDRYEAGLAEIVEGAVTCTLPEIPTETDVEAERQPDTPSTTKGPSQRAPFDVLADELLTALAASLEDDQVRRIVVEQALAQHETDRGLSAPRTAALAREATLLGLLADEIETHSDVMLRGYTVRSRIPLLGPLVAWVRRNATSHLREPYLDPTLERQVALNRRLAEWLQRATAALDAALERQATLEAQVETLARRLEEENRE